MRKLLGVFFIALPVVLVVTTIAMFSGWLVALIAVGTTAALAGSVALGCWLLS